MIAFNAELKQFGELGEKTGWIYIDIPVKVSNKLNPGVKLSYRIKGKIDAFQLSQVAIIPMGNGLFIMPVNATMRKAIRKTKGATVKLEMELDKSEFKTPELLMDCLADEPEARKYFESLPKSHQRYYSKWIESAKTDATKTKRVALAINAFVMKLSYAEMLRMQQEQRIK